jgi:hypothetical protein
MFFKSFWYSFLISVVLIIFCLVASMVWIVYSRFFIFGAIFLFWIMFFGLMQLLFRGSPEKVKEKNNIPNLDEYDIIETLNFCGIKFDLNFGLLDLPDGWKSEPDENKDKTVWFNILDTNGRIRFNFYEGPFGISSVTYLTRLSIVMVVKEDSVFAKVSDCSNVVHTTKFIDLSKLKPSAHEKQKNLSYNRAMEWLEVTQGLVDWRDPKVYWDDKNITLDTREEIV